MRKKVYAALSFVLLLAFLPSCAKFTNQPTATEESHVTDLPTATQTGASESSAEAPSEEPTSAKPSETTSENKPETKAPEKQDDFNSDGIDLPEDSFSHRAIGAHS